MSADYHIDDGFHTIHVKPPQVRSEQLPWRGDIQMTDLAEAVVQLLRHGWPAPFLMMYDEVSCTVPTTICYVLCFLTVRQLFAVCISESAIQMAGLVKGVVQLLRHGWPAPFLMMNGEVRCVVTFVLENDRD